MKYKIIIELTTEAENPTEAMDISGEYLCGLINEGVHMKCKTVPLKNVILAKIAAISVCVFIICFIGSVKMTSPATPELSFSDKNVSAIQPPLKTYIADKGFVSDWNGEKDKSVLKYVKD